MSGRPGIIASSAPAPGSLFSLKHEHGNRVSRYFTLADIEYLEGARLPDPVVFVGNQTKGCIGIGRDGIGKLFVSLYRNHHYPESLVHSPSSPPSAPASYRARPELASVSGNAGCRKLSVPWPGSRERSIDPMRSCYILVSQASTPRYRWRRCCARTRPPFRQFSSGGHEMNSSTMACASARSEPSTPQQDRSKRGCFVPVLAFAFSDQRFHPVPAEAVAWCLPPHAGEASLREFRVGVHLVC